MRNLTFLVLSAAAVLFTVSVNAQTKEKKGIVYSSSFGVGGQIYSNGWSGHLELSKFQGLHKRNFYQFEIAQLKQQKEVRQTNDYGFSIVGINPPRPYVYGKQNNFYQVNISRGQERMIGQRAAKSGVEVSVKYMAGFSLGVLKPYYLQLLIPQDQDRYRLEEHKYSDAVHNSFLDWYLIYGSAGFSKGLDEPKLVPGAHLKAGLKFDWAFYDEYIKALEVGGVLDVYPNRVPIMVTEKNQRVFPNFYVGIQFGKKKA
ncbi:MAG TPA: hypothetical protein VEY71_09415 [Chitinophagales bacterium]|nr:hypothetical protein [Chitinophagales bacterium]